MPDSSPGLDAIFCAAIELRSPEARAAYLADACGADAELRRQVESLVAAHFRAGSFLDRPPDPAGSTAAWTGPEGPGTMIGPYRLLEQIGEGGMGVVYVAEQAEPVKRRVALKVIKPGMDTRQVVARFEAERQALALMDHPNIARILDGGATDRGRPFFVMELVRGLPITDYCDRAGLPPRDRLRLFAQVCRAVQHAHQKGVIHRDLKPQNVLVTLHDGVPVPKVIDFGVAKAVGQSLTDRSVYTRFAQLVGTPLYMAPEQAELSGPDVDTRADVYSLGVLLYELLTGATPFDPEAVRAAALDEVRRMIREDDPPRPSQRLSTLSMAERSSISGRRGLDERRLAHLLRGDLDWVAMKALEKDRNRRYESAGAFAADVDRYLADQPVEARPPSAWYRVRKAARRNRAVLVTALLVAAALVAGTAVSVWQAVRATDARHQAEADREQAEADRDRAAAAERQAKAEQERAEAAEQQAATEAAIARAVNAFLQEDLLRQVNVAPRDEMEAKGSPNLTVKEALDRAAARVAERFRDEPAVEAAVRTAIGEAYGSLGEARLVAEHLERALSLHRAHTGPEHGQTLRVMRSLADTYTWVGRYSDAIALHEQLVEAAKARLRADDPELFGLMTGLAVAYRRAGDWQKAMRLLEQVVDKDTALRGPTLAGASESARILATLYQDGGMYKESAARLDRVLALRKRLGADPDATLPTTDGRILAYQLAGRLEDADPLIRRNLGFWRKRGDSLGQINQAHMLEMLSVNLLLQNRPVDAEPVAREALAIYQKHPATDGEWRRPYLMNVLGGILLAQKNYAGAEPLLLEGYAGMKQAEATMIVPWRRFRLTEAGERIVRYYEETRQPDKAREWREELSSPARPK